MAANKYIALLPLAAQRNPGQGHSAVAAERARIVALNARGLLDRTCSRPVLVRPARLSRPEALSAGRHREISSIRVRATRRHRWNRSRDRFRLMSVASAPRLRIFPADRNRPEGLTSAPPVYWAPPHGTGHWHGPTGSGKPCPAPRLRPDCDELYF